MAKRRWGEEGLLGVERWWRGELRQDVIEVEPREHGTLLEKAEVVPEAGQDVLQVRIRSGHSGVGG